MDDAPRTTDRWLPVFAVALIAEAAAGFTPPVATDAPQGNSPPAVIYACAAMAGLLGVATLIVGLRRNSHALDKALVMFAMTTVTVVMILNSFLLLYPFRSQARPPLLLLQPPSLLLMNLGAPFLWGAAIVRRDFPENEALSRIGRIGAGLVQGGFVFAVLYEVPAVFGSMRYTSGQSVGWYPLYSLLRLGSRVLLLWASIEMMRTAAEAAVLRLRARRVHLLMIGWIALLTANAGVGCLMTRARANVYMTAGPTLWRSLVSITIGLVAAFAAAKWLRSRTA